MKFNFKELHVFDFVLDQVGYYEEEYEGGEMHYSKKQSLRFFLQEHLIDLVKYNNWVADKYYRENVKVAERERDESKIKDTLKLKLLIIINEISRCLLLLDEYRDKIIQKEREKLL